MFAICSPWYSSSAVTSMVAEFGGIEGGIETMAHEMGKLIQYLISPEPALSLLYNSLFEKVTILVWITMDNPEKQRIAARTVD